MATLGKFQMFRIAATPRLIGFAIAACVATAAVSQTQETPEYRSFEGKPTLEELERVFGLDAENPEVESRAIYSVQGGFRFDKPVAGAATAAAPASPASTPAAPTAVAPTAPAKPAAKTPEPKQQAAANTPTTPPKKAETPQPQKKQVAASVTHRANIKPSPVPSVWVTEQIRFDNGSDSLVSSEFGIVDRVGEMMIAHPEVRVIISGHANATGAPSVNDNLSKQRAIAVRKYLWRSYAIPEQRFELRWMGAREALPGTAPADPENRRVQFGVMKPK